VLGFTPVRADQMNLVGNAVQALRDAIDACDGAVAILTGFNANVMYELGLAHAQGKRAILLCEFLPKEQRLPDLPFDLRNEYVIGYSADWSSLRSCLGEVLEQFGRTQYPQAGLRAGSSPNPG
jgi:hypothetical protein